MNLKSKSTLEKLNLEFRFKNYAENTIEIYVHYAGENMIQKKKKICKGTYKVNYFPGCGEDKYLHKFGLCNSCFMSWCFSTPEGKEYYKNQFIPAGKKKIKTEEKREQVNYAGKLQEKVQEIARLIDLGHKCLARDKMALSYDGGHVWAKGGHKECSLNLHNIFAQDSKSNQSTTEDQLMSEGIRREFGQDYFNFVESLKNKQIQRHLKADIEQMYRRACKIANKLIKEGKTYSKQERISLRNKFNLEIGYYPDELCVFKL